MKLCLGTAQFGLTYGINNKQGQVSQSEVAKILNFAHCNGIAMLDTASAYGNSEAALGEAIAQTNNSFNVITKYPNNQEIRPLIQIDTSLSQLKIKKVYGYLFHNYSTFNEHPGYIDDFIKIKSQGKAEKIGFSLYYPSEAEYLLEHDIPCDIVQVPYNIFDQRFASVFPQLKMRDIEIHVRSVFLQGLFFISPEKLSAQFNSAKSSLQKLYNFSEKHSIDISLLCLGFVNANKNIDKIVIGVDSLKDLQVNIRNYLLLNINFQELEALSVVDENTILPFKWKKL